MFVLMSQGYMLRLRNLLWNLDIEIDHGIICGIILRPLHMKLYFEFLEIKSCIQYCAQVTGMKNESQISMPIKMFWSN